MATYNQLTAPDPDSLQPFRPPAIPADILQRKVVLIATAPIKSETIFTNGLYQNIYIIYKLLEELGLLPFFLQTEAGAPILQGCRVITVSQLLQAPFPVYVYLEVGMSIDTLARQFMKRIGARNIKIYLGNILNIDIETVQFYKGAFFAHHVVGEMDEIWVSPHYEQHREYAGFLNRIYDPGRAKIVPFVWDPCFLTNFNKEHQRWVAPSAGSQPTYILMEPNISFQKNSLMPLLALEAYKKAHPDWAPRIILINGDRLKQIPHFMANIYETLTIKPYIDVLGRAPITQLLKAFPSATFICHQVNNEYNYMILELLYCGFPVIHNGMRWADFGYTYKENSVSGLLECVEASGRHGDASAAMYGRTQTLLWRHSIHNPKVQRAWYELLGSPYGPSA